MEILSFMSSIQKAHENHVEFECFKKAFMDKQFKELQTNDENQPLHLSIVESKLELLLRVCYFIYSSCF